MFKKLLVFTGFFLTALGLQSQGLLTHDFDDGQFAGFEIPKTDQEARVKIVDGKVQTQWQQNLYNGTNSGRKAQIRPDNNGYHFTKEFWTGYWLKIHNDYMAENTNTEACLMQIWGHDDDRGSANHYAMLKFDGRNGGALVWQHRYNSVSTIPQFLVYPNFPKDTFVKIVIHVTLAGNSGSDVQIWVDDVLRLNLIDQNFGWGEMDENGMYNLTYSSISYGQYNYMVNQTTMETYDKSNHTFNGHLTGETRTVTYDKVTLWDNTDGYSIAHPEANPAPIDDYRILKSNADFVLNGGSGASNGQNVNLYNNIEHKNLTWTEIDRGNGYYSYQKLNTNYCIDGNNGGQEGQNVHLWYCDEMNENQHWKKVDAGDRNYFLQKRNAPEYVLDAGDGGTNNQNVFLATMDINNANQQWTFTSEADNLSSDVNEFSQNVKAFPIPATDNLNVDIPDGIFNEYVLYNIHGAIVKSEAIENSTNDLVIDIQNLASGVYLLNLKGTNTTKTLKVVKE